MTTLKFAYNNSKMNHLAKMLNLKKKQVASFDLPAGYTCPMANKCKAYALRDSGKIVDGKNMVFRCYAASVESRFPNSRLAHWHNYDLLKSCDDMVKLIEDSLPSGLKILRLHSSGDFYSQEYFNAWVRIAELHPDIIFYTYTKVLNYVDSVKPDNFNIVYSYGGKMDSQLKNQATAYVMVESQAKESGLPIACKVLPADDYNYIIAKESFVITVHGTQPAKA